MKKIFSLLSILVMSFFLSGAATQPEEPEFPGMEFDFFDLEVMEEYLGDLVSEPGEERLAQEFIEIFEEKGYETRIYHSVGNEEPPYIAPFMMIINEEDKIVVLESEHIQDNTTDFIDIESFANEDGLILSDAHINPVELTDQEMIFYNEDQTIAAFDATTSTLINLQAIDPEILEILEQLNEIEFVEVEEGEGEGEGEESGE